MPICKFLVHPGPWIMIVFVNPSVGQRPRAEQEALAAALQICSRQADRAGDVVMVWQDAFGNAGFWGPTRHHRFFESASYEWLANQINGQLTCG